MTAPQGSDLQIGFCAERAKPNYIGQAINRFRVAKSVSGLLPKRTYERSENMRPTRQTPAGAVTRVAIAPKFEVQPDVDSMVIPRAHHNRFWAITSPAAGVQEWAMHPRQRGETAPGYLDTLDYEITDGDGNPILLTGMRQQDIEFKVSGGKLVSCSETWGGNFYSYASLPTRAVSGVGTTYTGKPMLVGPFGDATAGLQVKCKVFGLADVNADAYVKWTIGATAYSGTAIGIKFERYERVQPGTGATAGVSHFDDLYAQFPAGLGALAVDDEFVWTDTRTLAVASYSSRNVLSSAGLEVVIDGVQYGGLPNQPGFNDATLKLMTPAEPYYDAGLYPHHQRDSGFIGATLKLGRSREDRVLLQKCERAKRVAVTLRLWGDPIGSTGFSELAQISIPALEITDLQRDVSGPNALNEDSDLTAVDTGAPLWSELWRGTVATI